MSKMRTYEYVWLDRYQPELFLRSKIKATSEDNIPDWSFNASSMQQVGTGSVECLLLPVQHYESPFAFDYIVLCQVQRADHTDHPSNTRAAASEVVTDEWWFGFEQEYYLTHTDGTILGWERGDPHSENYCGVGASRIAGREIAEEHLLACLEAGIALTGINAESGLGQWEYQCFGRGIKAADDLWVSRYILNKIAEKYGVCVNYHPKMKKAGYYGSSMHTNFSNEAMRTKGDKAIFDEMCRKLGKCHDQAIAAYGLDHDMRLTGKHEMQVITKFSHGVSDCGVSIRTPVYTLEHGWKGYLEDRRPSSNADPYLVVAHIVGALK